MQTDHESQAVRSPRLSRHCGVEPEPTGNIGASDKPVPTKTGAIEPGMPARGHRYTFLQHGAASNPADRQPPLRLDPLAQLQTAIGTGDLAAAAACLKLVNPNETFRNGRTPLETALRCRKLQAVLALLNAGANPNLLTSENGMPPLALAARLGDLEAVEALTAAGANLNRRDRAGLDALRHAAHNGHHHVLARLLALRTEHAAARAQERIKAS